jgi:hypothetical protein
VENTQTAAQPEQPEEKRFTQAEVDEIVKKRLARERRKYYNLLNYVRWLERYIKESRHN